MLSKPNVFLIGPMGSGKSAVGRHLARLLRFDHPAAQRRAHRLRGLRIERWLAGHSANSVGSE